MTTMKLCIGVSFWDQCFVVLMQHPNTLHQMLQSFGRAWRQGVSEHSKCHVTVAWANDPVNLVLQKNKDQLWEKLSGQYIYDGK